MISDPNFMKSLRPDSRSAIGNPDSDKRPEVSAKKIEAQVPDFTISPESPALLESVIFNASDPQLDGTITKYEWDFGDGSQGSGRHCQTF